MDKKYGVVVATAVGLSLLLVGCADSPEPKGDEIIQAETKVEIEKKDGIRPELKELLDLYTEYTDEYVEFMSKPNGQYLDGFATLMSKYEEYNKKANEWDTSNLNDEEMLYYIQVLTDCNNKVLSVLDTSSKVKKIEDVKTPKKEEVKAPKQVQIDYEDVSVFEADLNKGLDLTGKTVRFTVDVLVPDGAFGYTLQTGEHLNFCSAKNPGVKQGDTITVKVIDITSLFGSYILGFEKL